MNSSVLDVIVIGGGHAGLSISYYMKKLHLDHLVFEKGRIGDTWRNQRWDSFRFNTPCKVNMLPGQENTSSDPEGFWSAREFVSVLEDYSGKFQLPVLENYEVLSVEKVSGENEFSVCVLNNGIKRNYLCKRVVVASGGQNRKFIPPFANNISPEIVQLHACEYKNASLLPYGAVLVIGSAQSGVQIAEDLIDSGKKVFVSTSQVARVPRCYRGKDIVDWLIQTGFYDVQTAKITDPQIFLMKFPQISGVGFRGHTLSLQSLARKGAVIVGKAINADKSSIYLQSDAKDHVKYADESSKRVKETIDEYIHNTLLNAPPPDQDAADISDENAECVKDLTSLNLPENKITSVIWTTGFAGDFSCLKLPVFSKSGNLMHHEGISEIKGLYFLGLPWLRKRKSGIVLGISEDSEYIAKRILSDL